MKPLAYLLMTAILIPGVVGAQGLRVKPGATLERTQTGHLEIVWGDPDISGVKGTVNATLVAMDGKRTSLDVGDAQLAAEDLATLNGRAIAVSWGPARKIEAIVPIADIVGQNDAWSNQARIDQWKTLGCKFPEWPLVPASVSYMNSQYGRLRGHIGHYWHELSYGSLHVQGRAHGWFNMPKSMSQYRTDDLYDTTQLAIDCAQAAVDAGVDLSTTAGLNLAFNRNLDNRSRGGRACGDIPGFSMRCVPTTWMTQSGIKNMRTLLHEMGHAYGLPHSDNSDGDNDTYDNVWDLMSSGAWGSSHPFYGLRPLYLAGWHRHRLGWVPAQRITTLVEPRQNRLIYLDGASNYRSNGKHYVILRKAPPRDREGNITQPHSGVHYMIEARLGDIDLDRGLPGQAVIIHRISNGLSSKAIAVDADTPPANINRNEGSMFKPGERWTAPEGIGTVRVLRRTPNGFLISVGPAR